MTLALLAVGIAAGDVTINPMTVLWVLGTPVGLALMTLFVRGILLLGKYAADMEANVTFRENTTRELTAHVKAFAEFKQTWERELHAAELSFQVIELDVNLLQQHAGVAVRRYPDRRSGHDRRAD